jgi:hypothetical protein
MNNLLKCKYCKKDIFTGEPPYYFSCYKKTCIICYKCGQKINLKKKKLTEKDCNYLMKKDNIIKAIQKLISNEYEKMRDNCDYMLKNFDKKRLSTVLDALMSRKDKFFYEKEKK